MSIISLDVLLHCYHKDGHNIKHDDFIGLLEGITDSCVSDSVADNGEDAASYLVLLSLNVSQFEREEEPYEAFSAEMTHGFELMAEWLNKQSSEVFEKLRNNDFKVSLFIDMWIDQDQLQLSLPARLLSSCARLEIGIEAISND